MLKINGMVGKVLGMKNTPSRESCDRAEDLHIGITLQRLHRLVNEDSFEGFGAIREDRTNDGNPWS